MSTEDVPTSEFIIRTVQLLVCYFASVVASAGSIAFIIPDGGKGHPALILFLFGEMFVSSLAYFAGFWLLRKVKFNLRCFFSLFIGTGITWVSGMLIGFVLSKVAY